MTAFFDYPGAAQFGRALPKNKIYEHAGASKRLKQLFVDQVDQITWRYKLAPETINLESSPAVPEIQVFAVSLRSKELAEEVLRAIDISIHFPILFELTHSGKRKAIAAFKRPNEADPGKWVVSSYFGTGWEAENGPRARMPAALNLAALYDRLLGGLLPAEVATGEGLVQRVAQAEAILAKRRDIARIKARLDREKQFNKKVAINAELRDATNQLKNLTGKGTVEA
jgi:hypothetical protein